MTSAQINMADSQNADAQMADVQIIESIDFSEGSLGWLKANHQKLEEMVRRKQKIWNLADWEEFERWSNNQSQKLEAAWAQQRMMEVERTRMQVERRDLMLRIQRLQTKDTFSSVPPDYRTGMIAIERLVLAATSADGRTLPPAGGEERILDRLDKLVERMALMENDRQRRMDAGPETAGDEGWDPATSILANRAMHDLLNFR